MLKKILLLFNLLFIQNVYANWQTIFGHGIIDSPNQITRFKAAINTTSTIAIKFADSLPAEGSNFNGLIGSICKKILKKNVNRQNMYMGQELDIQTIHETISKLDLNDEIVLFGVSRGGAAMINYLAEYNPTQIKALILDETPADMPATLIKSLAKLGINPKYALSIFTKIFPAYPKTSLTPLEAIKNIKNKNLPIFIIHSFADSMVPYQQSCMLYQKFKKEGFTNVHLTILPKGQHSFLLQDVQISSMYLDAINDFYQKYDLPYNQTHTINATFDLAQFTPSDKKIEEIIQNYQTGIEKTYQQAYARNMLITATTSVTLVALFLKTYKYNMN